MTIQKYLKLHRVNIQDMAKFCHVPWRTMYRLVSEGCMPSAENILKIKVFTDGKVDIEDWFHDGKKPRPSLQDFRDRIERKEI